MLRVITLNLNGIRSATSKGFLRWLQRQKADLVCVQELKAQAADMTAEMLAPCGFKPVIDRMEPIIARGGFVALMRFTWTV